MLPLPRAPAKDGSAPPAAALRWAAVAIWVDRTSPRFLRLGRAASRRLWLPARPPGFRTDGCRRDLVVMGSIKVGQVRVGPQGMVVITSISGRGRVRALWLTGPLADGREDEVTAEHFSGRWWRVVQPAQGYHLPLVAHPSRWIRYERNVGGPAKKDFTLETTS